MLSITVVQLMHGKLYDSSDLLCVWELQMTKDIICTPSQFGALLLHSHFLNQNTPIPTEL